MSEYEPCEATVPEPPYYLHDHPCERRAKTYVDNHGNRRGLCLQHAKQYAKNPRAYEFSWGWWRG